MTDDTPRLAQSPDAKMREALYLCVAVLKQSTSGYEATPKIHAEWKASFDVAIADAEAALAPGNAVCKDCHSPEFCRRQKACEAAECLAPKAPGNAGAVVAEHVGDVNNMFAAPVEAWQPIETAPKDKFILLYCKEDGSRWLAKWQGLRWYGVDDYGLTREGHSEGDPEVVTGWAVNGWMPLPAAPLPATQGDGG